MPAVGETGSVDRYCEVEFLLVGFQRPIHAWDENRFVRHRRIIDDPGFKLSVCLFRARTVYI